MCQTYGAEREPSSTCECVDAKHYRIGNSDTKHRIARKGRETVSCRNYSERFVMILYVDARSISPIRIYFAFVVCAFGRIYVNTI